MELVSCGLCLHLKPTWQLDFLPLCQAQCSLSGRSALLEEHQSRWLSFHLTDLHFSASLSLLHLQVLYLSPTLSVCASLLISFGGIVVDFCAQNIHRSGKKIQTMIAKLQPPSVRPNAVADQIKTIMASRATPQNTQDFPKNVTRRSRCQPGVLLSNNPIWSCICGTSQNTPDPWNHLPGTRRASTGRSRRADSLERRSPNKRPKLKTSF